MIYTSTKDAIRKKLVGIGTEIQATDKAEISQEAVLEKVRRK
jgi:cofilin